VDDADSTAAFIQQIAKRFEEASLLTSSISAE